MAVDRHGAGLLVIVRADVHSAGFIELAMENHRFDEIHLFSVQNPVYPPPRFCQAGRKTLTCLYCPDLFKKWTRPRLQFDPVYNFPVGKWRRRIVVEMEYGSSFRNMKSFELCKMLQKIVLDKIIFIRHLLKVSCCTSSNQSHKKNASVIKSPNAYLKAESTSSAAYPVSWTNCCISTLNMKKLAAQNRIR